MKFFLRTMIAATFAVGLGMSVSAPDAVAQQKIHKGPHKSKAGPGPKHGHGGGRHTGGRHRGGKIAGGIAAGIAGALILNEIAKSQAAPAYRDDGLSCRQLRFRCEDGRDWACRKFDRQC
ncbi:MAG: hypothetical protein AB7L90_08165 [Hyphomicrobiaceae bacterium]